MKVSSEFERISTEQFLSRLGVAIDEARLAKLSIQSSDLLTELDSHRLDSRRLLLVNREIELLEAKLNKVRCRLN